MTKALIPVVFGVLAGFLATYLILGDRDIGTVIVDPPAGPAARTGGADAPAEGLEQHPAMIAALEAELESDPANVQLLTDIGGLYYDLESFERAVDYYGRALAIEPEDVNLRIDLGTSLYFLDRTDEAIAELERALAGDPDHPLALFNLGAILVEARNDTDRAIELWEHLIAENPGWEGVPTVRQELESLRLAP